MLAMGRGRGPRPARSACLAVLALLLGLGAVRAEEEAAAGPVWARSSTGLEVWGVSSLRVHPKRPETIQAITRLLFERIGAENLEGVTGL